MNIHIPGSLISKKSQLNLAVPHPNAKVGGWLPPPPPPYVRGGGSSQSRTSARQESRAATGRANCLYPVCHVNVLSCYGILHDIMSTVPPSSLEIPNLNLTVSLPSDQLRPGSPAVQTCGSESYPPPSHREVGGGGR